MRVAVAGVGSACVRGHLPAIAALERERKLTLVGVADPAADRRAVAAGHVPGVAVFDSAREMLGSVACELLVVATEPATHADLVALGIEHGLHVVCEKPLTVSRAQHDIVSQACARRPDLALVPVHQYRFSPPWTSIVRIVRCAAQLRIPYSLSVELERAGTDGNAVSQWRSDIAGAGGMLADAGVHFLALAWAIEERLEVLAGDRRWHETGGERSAAIVRLGSGVLTIRAWNGARARLTRVDLRFRRGAIRWSDHRVSLELGGRTLAHRRVDALSDRSHVDALYLPFYRDLVGHLDRPSWRMRRTAEALSVGDALVTLLERTPLDVGLAA